MLGLDMCNFNKKIKTMKELTYNERIAVMRILWDIIGRLPPKYRAVIHLYYYERYSQEQIAEILKISRTTVQTRMARARKLLKKELKHDV